MPIDLPLGIEPISDNKRAAAILGLSRPASTNVATVAGCVLFILSTIVLIGWALDL